MIDINVLPCDVLFWDFMLLDPQILIKKNICDETVFSVISNSVILANFTAKWSAKSFTCR